MVATTTLNVMLPEFAQHIGVLVQSSDSSNRGQFTTTTGHVSGTSVVSTELGDEGFGDDRLNNSFIRFTSGNNDGVIRYVEDYDSSTDTITVSGSALTTDANAVTFELYRMQPRRLIQALNSARIRAFPSLYSDTSDRTLSISSSQQLYARPSSIPAQQVRQVFHEPRVAASTFSDNIIRDSSGVLKDVGFENSTISTDWTASSITLTSESSSDSPRNYLVLSDSQSAKCVTGASVGTLLCSIEDSTHIGNEINFSIWVYCQEADYVGAVIYEDSSQTAISALHGGGGWQRLSVSAVPAIGISTLEVGLKTTATAATFWADEAIAVAGQSEAVRIHANPVLWWREEGDYIRVDQAVPDVGQLLVRGHGFLSSVSNGTDTMELNEVQRKLLYSYAALDLVTGSVLTDSGDDQNEVLRSQTFFANRAEEGAGGMAQLPLIRQTV